MTRAKPNQISITARILVGLCLTSAPALPSFQIAAPRSRPWQLATEGSQVGAASAWFLYRAVVLT